MAATGVKKTRREAGDGEPGIRGTGYPEHDQQIHQQQRHPEQRLVPALPTPENINKSQASQGAGRQRGDTSQDQECNSYHSSWLQSQPENTEKPHFECLHPKCELFLNLRIGS